MTDREVFGSWKEIADYLGKEIRTCWRWEKQLGLPVHRIDSTSSRSRVFAYRSELDTWLRERADRDDASTGSRVSKWFWLAGGAVLSGLAAFIIILGAHHGRFSTRNYRPLSIGVLPIVDERGPKQEAYYSEGITQEVVRGLRSYDGISVIPFPVPTENTAVYERPEVISRELGLDYVLKGRLRRQNNVIFLAVEFIKAKDDQSVWTEEYRNPLGNLVAVKDDIQSHICQVLNIRDTRAGLEPVDRASANQALSLEDYIKGNFILSRLEGQTNDPWLLYYQGKFYSEQYTAADNELAINLFRRAIDANSSYSRAYIGLANCYINYVAFNWDPDIQWLNKAEELLNKAQALEPDLPEYFGAMLVVLLQKQFCFGQDKEEMIGAILDQGLRLYPNDEHLNSLAGIHYYRLFARDGRTDDLRRADEFKHKAFWLNPYSFDNVTYADLLLVQSQFDKAVEVCKLAEKLDGSLQARFMLGEAYYYQGNMDASWSIFQSYDALPRLHAYALYFMAMIAAHQGQAAAARKILDEINLVSPGNIKFFTTKLYLASAHLGLGDRDAGFKLLAEHLAEVRAGNERFVEAIYVDIDPNIAKYRNDPKYLEVVKTKEQPRWLGAQKSK